MTDPLLTGLLSFMNSGKEDKSRIEEKLQKRHSLCQELYTSEVNCLRFLDFLCKVSFISFTNRITHSTTRKIIMKKQLLVGYSLSFFFSGHLSLSF